MALDQSALLELTEALKAGDGASLMRTALQTMLQALIEAEATAHIGAEPHQRSEARTTRRTLLAPRRDVALHAVVMQAYDEGVSTRRVDDLVVATGGTGISRSEVSRSCARLDGDVAAWRSRPLDEHEFSYVFLDATHGKARINHRVVSQAVVIATGVSAHGPPLRGVPPAGRCWAAQIDPLATRQQDQHRSRPDRRPLTDAAGPGDRGRFQRRGPLGRSVRQRIVERGVRRGAARLCRCRPRQGR